MQRSSEGCYTLDRETQSTSTQAELLKKQSFLEFFLAFPPLDPLML